MKQLVFTFCLILASTSLAQDPMGAMELTQRNVLYRGYPNKVVVAVTNNTGKEVELVGSNVEIEKSDNAEFSNNYIIKPGKDDSSTLSVLLVDDNSVDKIKTIEYRVWNLPDPEIYWGGSKNGQKGNILTTNFFAKYPPNIPLNATFRILTWKIFFEGDSVSGVGSNISKAEEFLKKIPKETTLNFKFCVIGSDGIKRYISAQWKVVPWKDEKENPREPKVFRCG